MAGKRQATSELNADNWDQEEEQEDAGIFKKASEDILKGRVVKTARRRLPAADSSTKSAFGGFAGFKTSTGTPAPSPFSFLKASSDSSAVTSTSSSFMTNKTPTTNGSTKISENGVGISVTPTSSSTLSSKDSKTSKLEPSNKEGATQKKPSEYFAKLKGLNQSVANWIKSHVDTNPVCILTPIFRDYEKYLKEIEAKHGKEVDIPKAAEVKEESKLPKIEPKVAEKTEPLTLSEKKQENFVFASSSAKSSLSSQPALGKSIFSSPSNKSENKSPFGVSSTITSDKVNFLTKTTNESKDEEPSKSEEKTSTKLSFTQANTATTGSTFSFGQNSSTGTTSAQFSFGTGKPFTFGGSTAQVPASEEKQSNEEKEDEDEQPPKVDFKPITEEGSIFEMKCKVFVKKDTSYGDRGVGTLFLKPAPNDKMQLIVRAANSLGTLLLNIMLTKSIPVKRLNKTNIMLVCTPLLTEPPPPVPTLLRVKTSEEADLLFETLEKHKK